MAQMERQLESPDYVKFPQKQKEALLSQWGVVDPRQRAIFFELCAGWQPEIKYAYFYSTREARIPHLRSELENLLKRLSDVRAGLLCSKKNAEGDLEPDRIILTPENDRRFWSYFVEEEWRRNALNSKRPFLGQAHFLKQETLPPAELVREVSVAELTRENIQGWADNWDILSLPLLDREDLLFSGRDAGRILATATQKILYQLGHSENLAAVSRYMQVNLTEVKNRLGARDPLFWHHLCRASLDYREDMEANKKLPLDRLYFSSCHLVAHYTENQLMEAKKRKEETKEREQDLQLLENQIIHHPQVLVSEAELKALFQTLEPKYGDRLAELEKQFMERYLGAATKTQIAPILELAGAYIHRDNVYRLFLADFEALQAGIRREMGDRMEFIMKTGNRNNDSTFLNAENLEHALQVLVQGSKGLVPPLFKEPKTLAEALIHHGKTKLNIQDINDLKGHLEPFFLSGTMKLRPLVQIFGIQPGLLFERSFKKLSLLRQLFIRITGRFESYRESFLAGQAPLAKPSPKSVRPSELASAASGSLLRKDQIAGGSTSGRGAQSRSSGQEGSKGPRSRPAPAPPPPKQYSRREQESAWSKFSQSINKKEK